MTPTSIPNRLAAAAGGLVVLGTIGCTTVTVLGGVALVVVGGGTGYLGTESVVGAIVVSVVLSLVVGMLYASRRTT